MFNDEDEDENAIGAVRYPCTPSLVSLQQMRNRLHLAYLGRKLMKWTALATGRELRRLAIELESLYRNMTDEFRDAYMMIARARYYYANLNKMVTESLPKKASVSVVSSIKTVSSVKVVSYEIRETGLEPYEHLGIDKGGQHIHEAKIVWLELLKKILLAQEMRNSFIRVQAAHLSATKYHSLLRPAIPRANTTVQNIMMELEDLVNQELARIKVAKRKEKHIAENGESSKNDILVETLDRENPVLISTKDIRSSVVYLPDSNPLPKSMNSSKTSINTIFSEKSTNKICTLNNQPVIENCKQNDLQIYSRNIMENKNHLKYLKELLNEICTKLQTVLHKDVSEIQENKLNAPEVLKTFHDTKHSIDNLLKTGMATSKSSKIDIKLRNHLGHIEFLLKQVIDLTNNIRNKTAMENFVESVNSKLDVNLSAIKDISIAKDSEARLLNFKLQVKEVGQMIQFYRQERLTASVENLASTCASVRLIIDDYTKALETKAKTERKSYLNDYLGLLENLTTDIKQKKSTSAVLKIDIIPDKSFKINIIEDCSFENLAVLDELLKRTIDLGFLAKKQGFMDQKSVQNFMKYCQNINKLNEMDEKSLTLPELKTNIGGVIKWVNDLKADGILQQSVDDFLKTCKISKRNMMFPYNVYSFLFPNIAQSFTIAYSTCAAPCDCIGNSEIEPCSDLQCRKCKTLTDLDKTSASTSKQTISMLCTSNCVSTCAGNCNSCRKDSRIKKGTSKTGLQTKSTAKMRCSGSCIKSCRDFCKDIKNKQEEKGKELPKEATNIKCVQMMKRAKPPVHSCFPPPPPPPPPPPKCKGQCLQSCAGTCNSCIEAPAESPANIRCDHSNKGKEPVKKTSYTPKRTNKGCSGKCISSCAGNCNCNDHKPKTSEYKRFGKYEDIMNGPALPCSMTSTKDLDIKPYIEQKYMKMLEEEPKKICCKHHKQQTVPETPKIRCDAKEPEEVPLTICCKHYQQQTEAIHCEHLKEPEPVEEEEEPEKVCCEHKKKELELLNPKPKCKHLVVPEPEEPEPPTKPCCEHMAKKLDEAAGTCCSRKPVEPVMKESHKPVQPVMKESKSVRIISPLPSKPASAVCVHCDKIDTKQGTMPKVCEPPAKKRNLTCLSKPACLKGCVSRCTEACATACPKCDYIEPKPPEPPCVQCKKVDEPPIIQMPLPPPIPPSIPPTVDCTTCNVGDTKCDHDKETGPCLQPLPVCDHITIPTEEKLGQFTNKERTIKKVTRSLNEDGTIKVVTETIVIRKTSHDPYKTSFNDDDEDTEYEVDDDDIDNIPEEKCGQCETTPKTTMHVEIKPNTGFIRKTKSEQTLRLPPMAVPELKQTISMDVNMLRDNNYSNRSFEVLYSLPSLDRSETESFSSQK